MRKQVFQFFCLHYMLLCYWPLECDWLVRIRPLCPLERRALICQYLSIYWVHSLLYYLRYVSLGALTYLEQLCQFSGEIDVTRKLLVNVGQVDPVSHWQRLSVHRSSPDYPDHINHSRQLWKVYQVWSLTQFYPVGGVLQSRISVKNVRSTNTQSRFVSVVFEGVGTFEHSTTHMLVSLFLGTNSSFSDIN